MDATSNVRTFLGWEKSFPTAVTQHLVTRRPNMDFAGVTLVVSGGRAGRRILALLADAAAERGLAMLPPDIVTIGELPERLYRPQRPRASNFVRQAAWVAALEQIQPEVLQLLFPRLHAGDGPAGWNGAAAILDRCHEELAAGMVGFADAAEKSRTQNGLGDSQRWEAAASIHAAYRIVLKNMGFCDHQEARVEAMESGAITAHGPIILAGVVELSQQVQAMLNPLAAQVESLIYAPAEHVAGFDHLGCVNAAYWADRQVDLADANLRVAETISDQAEEVFVRLGELGSKVRTDEVTIGITDESIVPHLEATAVNLDGVPVRYGAGTLLSRTRPFGALKVVADYLESGEFRDFSILVRHPDVDRFIREAEALQLFQKDWRPVLDRYAANFLPGVLGTDCREARGWRCDAGAESSSKDEREDLAWLYCRIETLLGDLRRPDDSSTATADQWAEPILALSQRLYGKKWDTRDEGERLVVNACRELRKALDEFHAAGDIADRSAFQQLTADQAIHGLLALYALRKLPPPLTGDEIEIVGWLELMPDDAKYLVVTGINEGQVPESSRIGPLINETVRETLGLVTDRDRLARDAYILTAIVESRAKSGGVTLITGRKSLQNDPLLPSRLLFACDVKTMASRVKDATKLDLLKRTPLMFRFGHAEKSGFKIGATIPPNVIAPSSMRVTAFRDYLASPQGFYLRHVLGLETLDDVAPRELDPRQCGTIIHDVLNAFQGTPAANSASKQQCQDTLADLLERKVADTFGTSLTGAMKFQIAMIHRRLEIVAERQARWFADGWRIVHAEWGTEGAELPGDKMRLKGRIDRIDHHDEFGYAILDYKICNGKKLPDKTHRDGDGWIDLQLPLYRHLAREIILDKPVKLGYFVVSDQATHTGQFMADWNDAILEDADNKAREVAGQVWRGEFSEVGENPPTDGIFGHIFGEGVLTIDVPDDSDEDMP